MIKILLYFVLIFSVSNAQTQLEQSDITQIVNSINKINSQIEILSIDDNSTNKLSIDTLSYEKSKLLEQIPMSIMAIDFSSKQVQNFLSQKEKLQKNVAKYSTNKQSQNYIKNALELEKFNLNEIFYTSIIKLEEMFKDAAKLSSIKNLLTNSIIELKTHKFNYINDIKDTMIDEDAQKLAELRIFKKTADEILVYLKNNAELLSSSFSITRLNLNTAVEYINNKISLKNKNINLGKILVIFVVFVFFVSLTKILSKITYWVVLSVFAKNANAKTIKEQILDIIKLPISSLLIAYALKTCMSLTYYPAPMPLNIANAFIILYILLGTWLVATILNGYGMLIISEVAKKSGRKEIVNLIIKIVNFIVFTIAILLVLSRLGFDISAIIASLGIGGLAVAFAAKDIIANFFASVMLLFDNSFSQGDLIVCNGIEGTIVEIGLRKTTIRSADNALIFVPNSTLAGDAIINWSRRKAGRIINITIALTYDSKPEQLRQCINDIKTMLHTHPEISREDNGGAFGGSSRFRFRDNIVSINDLAGYKNAIYVSLDALNDSSIDIAVTCFSKAVTKAEYVKTKEDILFKIMDIVAQNNLEFAFPSQSLYLQNNQNIV
ncbi:hypothetical protein LMG7974_01129 [Campylobacter majalis]|uniref:Mechanosensitive ion channel family protein n=1 Tax=Campylobacter majalis TaxID=2790656 RepID=A0ABN7K8H6_9BACT|nr:mechanosensitive ion channel domain-containing protein [Campylobacter majalis]CAD7288740.1 hypothetical protein LMG7974_01129 [Campylobacter majalis]